MRQLPTATKLAKGTAKKCRVNAGEPFPAKDSVTPPSEMSQKAMRHWQYFCGLIEQNDCLTNVDVVAVALMCEKYEEYWDLTRIYEEDGPTIEGANCTVANPVARIRSACFKELTDLMKEFGLTPVARSKITKEPPKGGGNPFEAL